MLSEAEVAIVMLSEAEVAIVMLSGEQRSRNISREASAAKRTQAQEPSGSIWPHLTPKPSRTGPISPGVALWEPGVSE